MPRLLSPAAHTEEREKQENRPEEEREREQIIRECRRRLSHHLFSQRTQTDWMNMLENESLNHLRENPSYISQTVDKARECYAFFTERLAHAKSSGWISEKSTRDWEEKFFRNDIAEWDRRQWVYNEGHYASDGANGFLTLLGRWKSIADQRKETLKWAKEKHLTAKEIPALKELLSQQSFLAFNFHERTALVASVNAHILAYERNRLPLLESMTTSLAALATGDRRCLHPAKVALWLKRIMESDDPDAFIEKVLMPNIGRWQTVRAAFDDVEDRMKKEGAPQGFKRMKEHTFLLAHYDLREVYVLEATDRLDMQERLRQQEASALDAAKQEIREHMDIEDWDGARDMLQTLMHAQPTDPELRRMLRFVQLANPPQHDEHTRKRKEETEQARSALDHFVSTLPERSKTLIGMGLQEGSQSFAKVLIALKTDADSRQRQRTGSAQAAPPLIQTDDTPDAQVRAFKDLKAMKHDDDAIGSPRLAFTGMTDDDRDALIRQGIIALRHSRTLERNGEPYRMAA